MFVYPRDVRGTAWPERLYERIRKAGAEALRQHGVRDDYEPSKSYR